MITNDLLMKASEESVKFIDSMRSDELGIYTLRKAFEMGYLRGANDILKDTEELEDWEAVTADQAMTIAMLKQRERERVELVSLTNDEILEVDELLDSRNYSLFAYARAIEAKLKEKLNERWPF